MKGRRQAFTLIELLVVISVIALLLGILVPSLSKARQAAKKVISKSNLKQSTSAVVSFACDNKEKYPPTIAYIENGSPRTWLEPTTLVNYEFSGARSVSHYLYSYIEKASVFYCPGAPRNYSHMQRAWDAGDKWDNPDTKRIQDPLYGTYSYWWNYKGYLPKKGVIFEGVSKTALTKRQSKLLASCTFATTPNPYDWLDYGDFISCERFNTNGISPEYSVCSQMWNRLRNKTGVNQKEIVVNLNAAYVDGCVETFGASETAALKVSMSPNGGLPYFSPYIRGDFYLPEKAAR